jgi:hypothetical protein
VHACGLGRRKTRQPLACRRWLGGSRSTALPFVGAFRSGGCSTHVPSKRALIVLMVNVIDQGVKGFVLPAVMQVVAINKKVSRKEDDVVAHDAFLFAKRANTSFAPEPLSLSSAADASDK